MNYTALKERTHSFNTLFEFKSEKSDCHVLPYILIFCSQRFQIKAHLTE